jgi:hypothetical protein
MCGKERRGTERLLLSIPIRVMAFGARGGDFSEDTRTVEVNRSGARIVLRRRVSPDDELRIVNLENHAEADFRVIGSTRLVDAEVAEWGVECLDPGRNIWGIDFPPPLASQPSQLGALLECRGCGKQTLCVLSFMQLDMLDSTGALQRLCDECGELASWTYADVTRHPKDVPVPAPEAGRPPTKEPKRQIERRVHRRLALKLPIFVRTCKGEEEIAKTENISKGGVAVCLGMKLSVGEIVKVVCPFTEDGQNFEQKAEVRRRAPFVAGERWLYGFRYLT